MKRAMAITATLICCLLLTVTAYCENVFIVDEGDEDFVAPTTTTQPATTTETTTAPIIDPDAIGDYLGGISGVIGDGIGSLLDDFRNGFGSGQNAGQQGGSADIDLPEINIGNAGERTTAQTTTQGEQTTQPAAQTTTQNGQQEQELPSVLVVNQGSDGKATLSGSTLTLVVFVAAILILVLVVAIVLVVMTRKTEFDSAVRKRSTMPDVDRPRMDSVIDDGEFDEDDGDTDYSDITFWDK